MIFKTPKKLIKYLKKNNLNKNIITTSGGFDPVHVGHIQCIQESAKLKAEDDILVIIVNGDGFLKRKKGKPFMNHDERMKIIDALEGVDYVVGWEDKTQNVVGCIEILKPAIFTKGGDRSDSTKIAEWDVCQKINCKVLFGVGGNEKIQSSSTLIKKSDLRKKEIVDEFVGNYDHFEKYNGRFVEKPWGSERVLIEADKYVAKIINLSSNQRISRQFHNVKDETIYILSGILKVELGSPSEYTMEFLERGDVMHISPKTIHRFCSWHGPVQILEISTPELEDIVRLEDDYNRV